MKSTQPVLPLGDEPRAQRSALPPSTAIAVPAVPAAPAAIAAPKGALPTQQPLLLTVRDVEAELQLGRTRTYELIRSGELPVVRLGRVVRIPREALQLWIESHTTAPGSRSG